MAKNLELALRSGLVNDLNLNVKLSENETVIYQGKVENICTNSTTKKISGHSVLVNELIIKPLPHLRTNLLPTVLAKIPQMLDML